MNANQCVDIAMKRLCQFKKLKKGFSYHYLGSAIGWINTAKLKFIDEEEKT